MSGEVDVSVALPKEMPGYIMGRNGAFDLARLQMWSSNGRTAHINGIGKKGKVVSGGFVSVPAEAVDKLAMRWLEARGILMPAAYNDFKEGEG